MRTILARLVSSRQRHRTRRAQPHRARRPPSRFQRPIQVTGSGNPREFVTIVPKGAPEGRYQDYFY